MNNRNGLYFVIGALVVLVVGMGIYILREERRYLDRRKGHLGRGEVG